ncbi:hypothetical protein ACQPZ2_44225 (plasmid) [Nocardia pseudovaccinii]|uniref:hypothetical protein n=1 Tax=Nocardia pseudovaccinii TaxID=189540 RepID=UPI003D8AA977
MPVVSWPAAFLASVVVVASFSYHYMLITHGVDPLRAVQYLMAIVVPVTVLVLPSSAVGAGTRAVFRFLGAVFGNLGGGPR